MREARPLLRREATPVCYVHGRLRFFYQCPVDQRHLLAASRKLKFSLVYPPPDLPELGNASRLVPREELAFPFNPDHSLVLAIAGNCRTAFRNGNRPLPACSDILRCLDAHHRSHRHPAYPRPLGSSESCQSNNCQFSFPVSAACAPARALCPPIATRNDMLRILGPCTRLAITPDHVLL